MKRKIAKPQGPPLKLAYNRAEAARALGMSIPTLDRLVAAGLLKPCRATRRPLFTEAELRRFLEGNSK